MNNGILKSAYVPLYTHRHACTDVVDSTHSQGRGLYDVIRAADGSVHAQTMIQAPMMFLHPRRIPASLLRDNQWHGRYSELEMSGMPENSAALQHQANIMNVAMDKVCHIRTVTGK
jgi:hypothetical protein